MNTVDFSIGIILHNEGDILKTTFRNVYDMASKLATRDISYEIILNLDNPDKATEELATKFSGHKDKLLFGKIKIQKSSFGDPSLARNAITKRANGKCLAMLDGDDVFSEDWLLGGYRILSKATKELILHSQYDVTFGNSDLNPVVWTMSDSRSLLEDWLILFGFNPWGTGTILKTETAKKYPYRANGDKYGFEDWAFNIETRYGGVEHKIIPHSVKFYRKKQVSVFSEHKDEKRVLYPVEAYQMKAVKKMAAQVDANKLWDIPEEWNVPRWNLPLRFINKIKRQAKDKRAQEILANDNQIINPKNKLGAVAPELYFAYEYASKIDKDLRYSKEQLSKISIYDAMHTYIGVVFCERLAASGLVKIKNHKIPHHSLNEADSTFVDERIASLKR